MPFFAIYKTNSVRIWLKILYSVIKPIACNGSEVWGPLIHDLVTWDKHQIEIPLAELLQVQEESPKQCMQGRIRGISSTNISFLKRAKSN